MSRSEMDLSTIGMAFKAITLVARTRISKFPAAQGAVAAVEFALIVPLLLFLYIGSNELSEAISADRRVTLVSSTIGDLVARANGTLLQADLNDYFIAADNILFPLPIGPLEQIITSVSVDPKGVVTVVWSKRRDGSDGHTVGSSYELPAAMIDAAANPAAPTISYVIVSEASYPYEPLAGLIFKAAVPLYHRSFFIPRFGGKITIAP
jgi:Flp pilus assembly protein TadG